MNYTLLAIEFISIICCLSRLVTMEIIILFLELIFCLVLITIGFTSVIAKENTQLSYLPTELFCADIDITSSPASIIFIVIVSVIGGIILKYSTSYMDKDTTITRFIFVLVLFIQTMHIFIGSGNIIVTFIFWELLGIFSFLLILTWCTSNNAIKSGLKAVLINRIGDYCLSMVVLYCCSYFGFGDLTGLPEILQLLLSMSIMSKSAQVFLHVWLPDAMAAPTPVSSLLHAATMVTAGLFLFFKFNIHTNNYLPIILIFVSSVTIIYAGVVASTSFDLKRVVAFSTCSQLALISIALCTGFNQFAYFHLLNHAFFKACLFLNCGSIIHGSNDNQDIRKFGNIQQIFSLTFISFFISCIGLASLYCSASFYSKDLILDNCGFLFGNFNLTSWLIISYSIIFTVYYSILPIRFLSDNNNQLINNCLNSNVDNNPIILSTLSIISIISIGFPIYFFGIYNPELLKFLSPGLIVLAFIILNYLIYEYCNLINNSSISKLTNLKYLFDLSARSFNKLNSTISYIYSFKLFDKGLLFNFYNKFILRLSIRISTYFRLRNLSPNSTAYLLISLQFIHFILFLYFSGFFLI